MNPQQQPDRFGGGVYPSQVSPARRRLARLVQNTHFGRIQNLHVRGGEPVFDPAPLVVRTVKIGPTRGTRYGGGGGGRVCHVVEPMRDSTRSRPKMLLHIPIP